MGPTVNVGPESEFPPPGAGLETVSLPIWAYWIRFAGSVAVSCWADTNCEDNVDPFSWTTLCAVYPVPPIIIEVLDDPSAIVFGVALVIVGTGLAVNVYAPDAVTEVPSEFLITMSAAPTAWAGAVTERLIELLRDNDVTGVPPMVTETPDLKFVPAIVSEVPPAANPDGGVTEVNVGDG